MTAEETTVSKYKHSSQHSFVKSQYVLSTQLCEASQAREEDRGAFEEENKSKGCWIMEKSFRYWKETSYYKNRDLAVAVFLLLRNENYIVNGFFILIYGKENLYYRCLYCWFNLVKLLTLGSYGFVVSIMAFGRFSAATSIHLAFCLRPEPLTSTDCLECQIGKMVSSGK